MVRKELEKYTYPAEQIEVIHAEEVIETAEPPVNAIRKKKQSSIVVGMNMVKQKEADAFVSAGSSGAILVGGQVIVGRIKGIERPPLAPLIPTEKGVSLLIDCGANVDARASHLVQFAKMGSIYMENVLGIKNPRVAIVNIGAEEEKGNALVKETFPLLKECTDINFVGSIEAREIPHGEADVIVCEAFVGNVILKLYEGLAGTLVGAIKKGMINPIKKLQTAAQNIKDGNLDFSVESDSKDEIGELCRSFEEMRLRLKDNAEEKIEGEKENKTLISNIAHDLKTPITAVKGYAEGLMDGVADTPEKRDKYIRTIYNKANEMDTLLNELTLYAKIDTNRIPYNFAKINVSEYFNDCVEEIGLDLETKNIRLAYFNYVDENVLIIADPEQLRRVIHNIIGNSIKYLDKQQGFINIRIKDVGDFIQVEIEDNGRGISARDLPYIFDRFYRADASRNSATGGSGIGLSIVKKIIEDHGGKIWATSKESIGTVMYFVIRKYQEVPNE